MALILQIDTATEHACISVSFHGKVIASKENCNQKDHAAFVQPAIKTLCREENFNLKSFDAIAVISGPGSYTGLRVGLASAKGLCFALDTPLIMINTLEAMALSSILQKRQVEEQTGTDLLFCPMIDARRSEVFTAIYDEELNIVFPPTAVILDEYSFKEFLELHPVVFSGNGSQKFQKMLQHQNFISDGTTSDAHSFSILSASAFRLKSFADLAYAEPYYLKTFF
ncbi:MAG: tRNA (adenosine(37)-N6)-threonylcarbamoyltransferase complex dimerization subunit type 1 TsaB, partial [Chitinophagaceae bacterium]